MKKIYLALMCLASATMIAACGNSKPAESNENGEENASSVVEEAEVSDVPSILSATFPAKVKIVMKHRPSGNMAEETSTLIKIGNVWFSKTEGNGYARYMYCQYDKEGQALKAFGKFVTGDEDAGWDNLLETSDYSYTTFAGYAKSIPFAKLFDAGVPQGDCKKRGVATDEKINVLDTECTHYDYDFVVKADYYVNESNKIVYKFVNYLDKEKTKLNAQFEIVGWDTSVSSFEWPKP